MTPPGRLDLSCAYRALGRKISGVDEFGRGGAEEVRPVLEAKPSPTPSTSRRPPTVTVSTPNKWGRACLLGLAACALLLATPSQAPARLSHGRSAAPRFAESFFSLRATNGYLIEVKASPGDPEGSVTIVASRDGAQARYQTFGVVTPRRIEADFGSLGSLSLRFQPSGRVKRQTLPAHIHCPGLPHILEAKLGTFEGEFTFKGERGYTEATGTRLHGQVGDPFLNLPRGHHDGKTKEVIVCIPRSVSERKKPEAEPSAATSLEATDRSAKVTFYAMRAQSSSSPQDGPVEHPLFFAFDSEQRSNVFINRSAIAVGAPADFLTDPIRGFAVLKPPAPFRGRATLAQRSDRKTTWSGSLSVSFPGRPHLRLTGSGFEVKIQGALKPMLSRGLAAPGRDRGQVKRDHAVTAEIANRLKGRAPTSLQARDAGFNFLQNSFRWGDAGR